MTPRILILSRSAWALVATLAMALAIAVSFTSPLLAHDGEDHGDERPLAEAAIGPRVDAHSEVFELVAIPSARDGGTLLVYLQDYATNTPMPAATIDLTAGDQTATGAFKDGLYRFKAPWVLAPGDYDLVFSITAKNASDLLIGRLSIPAPPLPGASHDTIWDHLWPDTWKVAQTPLWMPLALLGSLPVLVLLALRLPHPGRQGALALIALTGISATAVTATVVSSGQHLNGAVGLTAETMLDLPEVSKRLDDGGIFVPKPAQRLFGIETVQSRPVETISQSVRLIGQVMPDTNRSGIVQALLSGRIEPPESGFPEIGARVSKGDVLGYIVPRVEVVDQSDIRQTQGDLDRQIELAEARLRRLEPLAGDAVPEAQVVDARIELEALRKRRTAIKPVLAEREALLAPSDGILAQANVLAGQVVEAHSLLFQIVDPDNLWVEALAYDAGIAAQIEAGGKDGFATTADGRKVRVVFAGRGMALRQQAIPLRFKVKPDGVPLSIGESVNVQAPVDRTLSSIPVPRASVVRGANGQSILWAHIGAERFEPRIVQSVPLDAGRLGITAGLKPQTRIVVRGAELINQVR